MKKLFLLFLIVPSFALAQNNVNDLMGLRMSAELASKIDQIYSSNITTDPKFAAGIQPKFPAAAVITPSTSVPTPSAGNTLSNRRTIVAAGAPTAAFVVLPRATEVVGETFTVLNQGSNPVAIVPQTGSINVSGALTPFPCTTLKECQCTGLTNSTFSCSQQ